MSRFVSFPYRDGQVEFNYVTVPGMKHEKILCQKDYLGMLHKFHYLAKDKGKTAIDEIIIEVEDKEVLNKIEIPKEIEELAVKNKMSLQDCISSILKCFVVDYVHGRDLLDKIILDNINKEI